MWCAVGQSVGGEITRRAAAIDRRNCRLCCGGGVGGAGSLPAFNSVNAPRRPSVRPSVRPSALSRPVAAALSSVGRRPYIRSSDLWHFHGGGGRVDRRLDGLV